MATIRDVALRAGVSVATVSRVINGVGSVQPERAVAVRRAIDEMDYKPNSIGRSLRRSETNRIIVLQPSISNPFFARVVRGIDSMARESGYQIMLCDTDNQPERELKYLELMDFKVADGAILVTSCKEPAAYHAIAARHPVIHCCEYYDDQSLSLSTMDNVSAARDATRYLIDLGHKRIAFLSAYNKYLTVGQRCQGYCEALEGAGLRPAPDLCVGVGPVHDEKIWEETLCAAARFADMSHPPSAIFCSSDMVAIATIHALKASGVRVPGDMSVMGFDDIDLARLFDPGLSTVYIPKHAIGREAMRMLLRRLENPGAPVERSIAEHKVIGRASTRAV